MAPRRVLPKEELRRHVRETPFHKDEVLRVWHVFVSLDSAQRGMLSFQDLINIPELRCNPFAGRIVELFSGDGSGTLCFNKFLHMLAVFSPRARNETKTVWAFALWDFDGDDVIGSEDLRNGLSLLLNVPVPTLDDPSMDPEALPDGLLSDAEVQQVVDKVAEEVDPEGLGLLFTDFEAVASRMPDFCVNLRIDL